MTTKVQQTGIFEADSGLSVNFVAASLAKRDKSKAGTAYGSMVKSLCPECD